ncbi:hypothetical protein J5069_22740 [Candidatus Symbiopectobacterium sp. NZEC127]|uniref:hypothetical protein n=1 Tax=Candidatus Symbiopectobacterium sp. NZEC127 TaxID=2820472 RepID=UPI0022271603|nr:hypothetical protein [Candidatus Symbiopectobacterium sp. NZEC127]MCW2488722.1 hypothetical protein [Candidatus Symbiopectobacterium sp. NZEC127]
MNITHPHPALFFALLLGISWIAQAAPDTPRPQPMDAPPFAKGELPPPPTPPLYQASMQTHQPAEALNKLIANAPQAENKNYEVRVMIRELPAPPSEVKKTDK